MSREKHLLNLQNTLQTNRWVVNGDIQIPFQALGYSWTPESLQKALQDENPWVKGIAAKALGRTNAKECFASLVPLLSNAEPWVRLVAIETLGVFKNPMTLATILKMFTDSDYKVRGMAALISGQFESDKAITPLQDLLKKEQNPEVIEKIAAALSWIPHTDSIDLLCHHLYHQKTSTLVSIITTLGILEAEEKKNEILPFLKHHDANVVNATLKTLAKFKSDSGYADLKNLESHPNPTVRQNLIVCYAEKQAKEALPWVREQLHSPEEDLLTAAIYAIGCMMDLQTLTKIIELTESKSPSVEYHAVSTLTKFRTPQARSTFLQKLAHNQEPQIVRQCLLGLAAVYRDEDSETFINALESNSDGVIIAAIESCGNLKIQASLKNLMALANHVNMNIRGKAIEAMGKIKHPASLNTLLDRTIEDSEFAVRYNAALALRGFSDTKAIPVLIQACKDEDHSVKFAAMQSLSQYPTIEAKNLICEHLNSEDEALRLLTIQALSKTDSSFVQAELKKRITLETNDDIKKELNHINK
jgi:HEAT repeat protein